MRVLKRYIVIFASILFTCFFIITLVILIVNNQRFEELNKEIQSLKQQQKGILLETSYEGFKSIVGQERSPFEFIRATFGPVEGDPTFTKIQLDWKDSADIQEISILDNKGALFITIVGKSASVSVPHPYIVGSVPEGFIVKEGNSFENLTPGKVYRAELKGEVDDQPFDIGFNFNVPEL